MAHRPARTLRIFLLFVAFFFPLLAQGLRFGVIGDSGSGESGQLAVARQMESFYKTHPWEFVLMLGDNIYDEGNPRDFDRKFKRVYRNLMAAGVEFHATLGNHDRLDPRGRKGMAQVEDDAFGYIGRQDEYVFIPHPATDGKALARFICLNSEAWLEDIQHERLGPRLARLRGWLQDSGRFQWNIAFFHEPIYSFAGGKTFGRFIGRFGHGPEESLRSVLEREFMGKLDAVLSGHEHFYQKIRPQNGIHYFISGGGSKIRRGVNRRHPQVEFAAESLHFMDFELTEHELKYAAISERGVTLHSGVISK